VASVEYDHYFDERWGVGFFVDAGDAAESFGQMHLAVGYGAGVRVRTLAGPLFFDVAYGQRDSRLRLHFSLGIAF
jgi:translocation and assembly module TamA